MNKLTFTLKQHTPLIHFQHDQAGATLRATEVKPKLDKYLLEILGGGNYDNGIDIAKAKNWLVGKGEHPALNYRMRFMPLKNPIYGLPSVLKFSNRRFPNRDQTVRDTVKDTFNQPVELLYPTPYFANADKIKFKEADIDEERTEISKLKLTVFSKESQNGHVLTFNSDLLEFCKSNLSSFFLKENFGSRQNKGFGSYTIAKINNQVIESLNINQYFPYKSVKKYPDQRQVFKFIHEEYQLLKSGINHGDYKKSKLFKHFINNEKTSVRWEKRKLKQFINQNKEPGKNLYSKKKKMPLDDSKDGYYNDYTDHQTNKYGFVRALLGLPGTYEFLIESNRDQSKSDHSSKYVIKISHNYDKKENEIERFKSPILFKVIDGFVYIKYDDSFKSILGESFKFELFLNERELDKSEFIDVPNTFDIKSFLDHYIVGKSTNWTNKF